jgi:hypothetical protein
VVREGGYLDAFEQPGQIREELIGHALNRVVCVLDLDQGPTVDKLLHATAGNRWEQYHVS